MESQLGFRSVFQLVFQSVFFSIELGPRDLSLGYIKGLPQTLSRTERRSKQCFTPMIRRGYSQKVSQSQSIYFPTQWEVELRTTAVWATNCCLFLEEIHFKVKKKPRDKNREEGQLEHASDVRAEFKTISHANHITRTLVIGYCDYLGTSHKVIIVIRQ